MNRISLNESRPYSLKAQGTSNLRTLRGIFGEVDAENQNGRVYPSEIYRPAVDEFMEKVNARSAMGELDHPDTHDDVKLANVSHVITKLWWEGNNLMGECEILDTPSGKIVQALLDAGIPVGISSRAVGDVVHKNGHDVVTSLEIITWDLVADPSVKTAVLDEVQVSKLGEALNRIEAPLRSSKILSESRVQTLINGIRESVGLADSASKSSLREVTGFNSANKDKRSDRKTIHEGSSSSSNKQQLNQEIEFNSLKSEVSSLKEGISQRDSVISEAKIKIQNLQESYNSLVETTVSKSEFEKLLKENLDLKKRLAVESRGLVYSQVSHLLEGATTMSEINARLDSPGANISRNASASKRITEMKNSGQSFMSQDSRRSNSKVSRLSNMIASL